MTAPMTAPPDTRDEAGENERSGTGRQAWSAPARETPVLAEGHCTGARQKAAFSFGPCNRAAVGGSAALRWTAVRGFAALRMSRPPCGEMRHTPCGYGPFVSGLSAAASGGWPPTRACGRSLFNKIEKKMGGGMGKPPSRLDPASKGAHRQPPSIAALRSPKGRSAQ